MTCFELPLFCFLEKPQDLLPWSGCTWRGLNHLPPCRLHLLEVWAIPTASKHWGMMTKHHKNIAWGLSMRGELCCVSDIAERLEPEINTKRYDTIWYGTIWYSTVRYYGDIKHLLFVRERTYGEAKSKWPNQNISIWSPLLTTSKSSNSGKRVDCITLLACRAASSGHAGGAPSAPLLPLSLDTLSPESSKNTPGLLPTPPHFPPVLPIVLREAEETSSPGRGEGGAGGGQVTSSWSRSTWTDWVPEGQAGGIARGGWRGKKVRVQ